LGSQNTTNARTPENHISQGAHFSLPFKSKIGAKADKIKQAQLVDGLYLDVRDRSWFVDRTNLDKNRSAAAAELARVVVDPLLESKGLLRQSAAALTGQDAKTALIFLELQWRNESVAKGLTKSAFEALVRGALHGTNSTSRMTRQAVQKRVSEFLPKHSLPQMVPYIDAALKRLSRSAVRHWPKVDEFNLSHEEIERLKDEAAAMRYLKRSSKMMLLKSPLTRAVPRKKRSISSST
jgi:hypothetical protein